MDSITLSYAVGLYSLKDRADIINSCRIDLFFGSSSSCEMFLYSGYYVITKSAKSRNKNGWNDIIVSERE